MTTKQRRKEILNMLEELWEKHPNERLGQLLENYVFIDGERGDKTSKALFYQEDEDVLERLKKELGEELQK